MLWTYRKLGVSQYGVLGKGGEADAVADLSLPTK